MSDIARLFGKTFTEHLADREKALDDVARETRNNNATYLKIAQSDLEDVNDSIDRMISGERDE